MKIPDNAPKIRNGQVWRKRDSKLLVFITGRRNKKGRTYYCYTKVNGKPTGHCVSDKDLWLFWEMIKNGEVVYSNTAPAVAHR